AVALDEKYRGFIVRAGHFLQRGHQDKQAGAFAVLDDASHVKITFENMEGLPDFDFFRRDVNIVNQNVVGIPKIAPGMKNESASDRAETFGIDAIHDVEPIHGIELQQHGRHGLHVIELLQFSGNRDGHGRAAEGHEDGGGRRLDHNVCAYAFDAFCRFEQQAAGEADDDNYQGHLDGNSNHCDQRAERPVQHVLYDHVPDHGCSFASSPTRTRSVPGGCWRTKRSAAMVSFRVTFLMVISNL